MKAVWRRRCDILFIAQFMFISLSSGNTTALFTTDTLTAAHVQLCYRNSQWIPKADPKSFRMFNVDGARGNRFKLRNLNFSPKTCLSNLSLPNITADIACLLFTARVTEASSSLRLIVCVNMTEKTVNQQSAPAPHPPQSHDLTARCTK